MSSRVRRPEVTRLELSRGDWLLVKKYLTAGEYRALLQASGKPVTVGPPTLDGPPASTVGIDVDLVAAGLATVLAYLLDWSFTDADDRPLVIADQPPAVVRAAMDAIDGDAYMEVQKAIQAHQNAVAAEVAAEKKILIGAPRSVSTLTSVG